MSDLVITKEGKIMLKQWAKDATKRLKQLALPSRLSVAVALKKERDGGFR